MTLKFLLLAGVLAAGLCIFLNGCCKSVRKEKIQLPANALLIDVRSADEFRSGHLPGAINIPHLEIAGKISGAAPDKTTPLYLYCRSGRRVKIAMETLKQNGYHTLYDLGGLKDAARALDLQPDQGE